ncbi:MAG: SCO family protein, partial [Acidobacteriaceae bacterium]|nr:SCO family protein [Acidobacteriaceae bacterium]
MMKLQLTRRWMCAAFICIALGCGALNAQVSSYGDKHQGENSGGQLPQVLQRVGVTQRLNQPLPLDAQFVDESGKQVRLGDYFGKRPAILTLVYFTCPMLCSEEMDGLASSLEMVHLTPGKDFDVIV